MVIFWGSSGGGRCIKMPLKVLNMNMASMGTSQNHFAYLRGIYGIMGPSLVLCYGNLICSSFCWEEFKNLLSLAYSYLPDHSWIQSPLLKNLIPNPKTSQPIRQSQLLRYIISDHFPRLDQVFSLVQHSLSIEFCWTDGPSEPLLLKGKRCQ